MIPFFNVHMWVCVNVSVDLVNKKKKKKNKQTNRIIGERGKVRLKSVSNSLASHHCADQSEKKKKTQTKMQDGS